MILVHTDFFSQQAVFIGVSHHLLRIAFSVVERHVHDVALGIHHGVHPRVYEALVGRDVQLLVPAEYLLVQVGIHLHAIAFHHRLRRFVVALALDALYLGEQRAEDLAQGRK